MKDANKEQNRTEKETDDTLRKTESEVGRKADEERGSAEKEADEELRRAKKEADIERRKAERKPDEEKIMNLLADNQLATEQVERKHTWKALHCLLRKMENALTEMKNYFT